MIIDDNLYIYSREKTIADVTVSGANNTLYLSSIDYTNNHNFSIASKTGKTLTVEISNFTESSGKFDSAARYSVTRGFNLPVTGKFSDDSHLKLISGDSTPDSQYYPINVGLDDSDLLFSAPSPKFGDTTYRRYVYKVPKGYKVTPSDNITMGYVDPYSHGSDAIFDNYPVITKYDAEYPENTVFSFSYYQSNGVPAFKFTFTKVDDSRDIDTTFTGTNFSPLTKVNTKNHIVTYTANSGYTFTQPFIINYYGDSGLVSSDSVPASGSDSLTINYRMITDSVTRIEVVGDATTPIKSSDFKHHYLVNQDTLNKMSEFITVKTVPNEKDYSVYVSSLYQYNFNINAVSTNNPIVLSNISSGYYSPELDSDSISFELGSINVHNSPVYRLDSNFIIQLPFTDDISVTYKDMFSKNQESTTLTFTSILNLNTGYMTYYITNDNILMNVVSVMVGSQIPFYSSQYALNINENNNVKDNHILKPKLIVTYKDPVNKPFYNHKESIKGSNLTDNISYQANIKDNKFLSYDDFNYLNSTLAKGFTL